MWVKTGRVGRGGTGNARGGEVGKEVGKGSGYATERVSNNIVGTFDVVELRAVFFEE